MFLPTFNPRFESSSKTTYPLLTPLIHQIVSERDSCLSKEEKVTPKHDLISLSWKTSMKYATEGSCQHICFVMVDSIYIEVACTTYCLNEDDVPTLLACGYLCQIVFLTKINTILNKSHALFFANMEQFVCKPGNRYISQSHLINLNRDRICGHIKKANKENFSNGAIDFLAKVVNGCHCCTHLNLSLIETKPSQNIMKQNLL